MKTSLFVGALAASVITIIPTVASAETNSEGRLVAKVAYSDLNLSTSAGKARLNQRINAAIREVCQRPLAFNLREKTDYIRCAAEALAASKKNVGLALNGSRSKARKA